MLLWSIMPTDFVFTTETDPHPSTMEIQRYGVTMVVEPLSNGLGRIERILSGNPQHYLRPEWQPGQYVPLAEPRR